MARAEGSYPADSENRIERGRTRLQRRRGGGVGKTIFVNLLSSPNVERGNGPRGFHKMRGKDFVVNDSL